MGEEVDGVDMRAEVGLLSRNILLRGEMEPGCYGNEACKFFNFDTFGGHLKVNSSVSCRLQNRQHRVNRLEKDEKAVRGEVRDMTTFYITCYDL